MINSPFTFHWFSNKRSIPLFYHLITYTSPCTPLSTTPLVQCSLHYAFPTPPSILDSTLPFSFPCTLLLTVHSYTSPCTLLSATPFVNFLQYFTPPTPLLIHFSPQYTSPTPLLTHFSPQYNPPTPLPIQEDSPGSHAFIKCIRLALADKTGTQGERAVFSGANDVTKFTMR